MKKTATYGTNMKEITNLTDDCLQDFLKNINRNKSATREENDKMFLQYRNGDLKVRDMIIEKNLNLVVSIVKKMGKNLNSDKKLEYIQSGIIGLIEAVDTFDLNIGTAFSTHAEYRIKMRINKYRYNHQRLVRRPQHIEVILSHYRKLLRDYEKTGKPLPSRDEICSILDVSDNILKRIEEDYKLDATSLDGSKSNDNQDLDDMKEFIGSEEKGYGELLDKIVFEEILKTIKMNITKYEYFIFYYRVIYSKQKTLKELGEYFGVSIETIRLIEDRTKAKIKKMFHDDYTLKRTYINEVLKKYSLESIKIAPCSMENYTMYFFLRDKFIEKDQIILKEILVGDLIFDSERIATEIMESKKYVEKKGLEMERLIEKTAADVYYNLFHNNLVKYYKSKIYCLELGSDLSEFLDMRSIVCDYWQNKTIQEVYELASLYNLPCSEKMMEKIKRFYGFAPQKEIEFNKERLERDVNYSLYGFSIYEPSLSELYPLFYKIEDYKKDNFSYEKYMCVRNLCLKNMDERNLRLLDFYYGVNGASMTIGKIAEFLCEDKGKVENDFRRAKNNAIAIYLGTGQYTFDKDIYRRVLGDENFTLGNPHFEVAKMFFLEGKTYEEIANEFEIQPKFSKRKVADLVKYACNAMDYYRFGITSTQKNYSCIFLLSVLEKANYSEEIKDIMRIFIETKSSVQTAEICKKSLAEVRNIVRRLHSLANKISIEQVEVTKEDVLLAIMEHESTNVLNEREKNILSLAYGLKNEYNPTGKKRYPIDIGILLGIQHNVGSAIRRAREHVAAHKIGLLKTAIDFMNREELENALRDQRLPLGNEDRNIIIDAYGLYDTKYLTIQEIAKKYDLKEKTARTRVYKGIITIKKYLNKEIEGNVLFEVDVEPYLKYFILEDREILTLLYRDKLSQLEIEKKYGFSTHQFALLLQKMRMHLKDLRSGVATGIDFDYFWSNALEKDIPFYGNQQLAVELCYLYYEERISQSDIIKYYHPELSDTTVSKLIKEYIVAVIKYQNGIRKANEFSYEEVVHYYNLHKDDFRAVRTKVYSNYFAKIERRGPFEKVRPNKFITYDLIKEKYPNYFRLENANANQVKEILGKYGYLMSKDTIQILESLFGVTHANMLSDEEWEMVIKFLGTLQLMHEKGTQIINKNRLVENCLVAKKKRVKNNNAG